MRHFGIMDKVHSASLVLTTENTTFADSEQPAGAAFSCAAAKKNGSRFAADPRPAARAAAQIFMIFSR